MGVIPLGKVWGAVATPVLFLRDWSNAAKPMPASHTKVPHVQEAGREKLASAPPPLPIYRRGKSSCPQYLQIGATLISGRNKSLSLQLDSSWSLGRVKLWKVYKCLFSWEKLSQEQLLPVWSWVFSWNHHFWSMRNIMEVCTLWFLLGEWEFSW